MTDEEELAIKIVVIGGTGLIASKGVAILRQGGHEMIVAYRQSASIRLPQMDRKKPRSSPPW